MKIYIKVLTIAACVYLLFVGIFNIYMNFQMYTGPIIPAITSLYFIPVATYIIYIALSIFVLIKLLLPKRILAHRIAGTILAASGILQIITLAFYFSIYHFKFKGFSMANIFQNGFLFSDYLIIIFIALLMILIFINTFKPFVNSKISLIICAGIFTLRVALYLIITFTASIASLENPIHLANAIVIILGLVLINASCIWVSYAALKK